MEIAIVLSIAAFAAVIGIRLGMLAAPRLDRLADPADEEPDARSDDQP